MSENNNKYLRLSETNTDGRNAQIGELSCSCLIIEWSTLTEKKFTLLKCGNSNLVDMALKIKLRIQITDKHVLKYKMVLDRRGLVSYYKQKLDSKSSELRREIKKK